MHMAGMSWLNVAGATSWKLWVSALTASVCYNQLYPHVDQPLNLPARPGVSWAAMLHGAAVPACWQLVVVACAARCDALAVHHSSWLLKEGT